LRTYEALYIVSAELSDDDIQTVDQGVQALITNNGGSVVRSEIWGRRKLAYLVGKHTDGCYILTRFQCGAEFPTKLETYFKLSESIIRYLLLHLDERTLRLEAEQARRREEDLRQSATRSRDDDGDDDDDDKPVRSRGGRYGRDEDDDD
jgi:small subunit ribosomal protein S6